MRYYWLLQLPVEEQSLRGRRQREGERRRARAVVRPQGRAELEAEHGAVLHGRYRHPPHRARRPARLHIHLRERLEQFADVRLEHSSGHLSYIIIKSESEFQLYSGRAQASRVHRNSRTVELKFTGLLLLHPFPFESSDVKIICQR